MSLLAKSTEPVKEILNRFPTLITLDSKHYFSELEKKCTNLTGEYMLEQISEMMEIHPGKYKFFFLRKIFGSLIT